LICEAKDYRNQKKATHEERGGLVQHATNGTLAFAPTAQANPSAKAKEPFFANAPLRMLKIF
jgi:hypothetical protein